MVEARFEVAIVGGGPAGSTTALRLARAGFSVALFEARRFPRFKACGEFMSPECLPLLADLGVFEELRALGPHEVRGMFLHAGGRRVRGRFVEVGRVTPAFDFGWAIRRERFDEVLLRAAQRAGVSVFEQHSFVGLERDESGAVVGLRVRSREAGPYRVSARWVVGADGLRSRVAQALAVRREMRWLRRIALTTRYAQVPWGDAAEVHFFDDGYFACTPVDAHLVSVNLVLDQRRFAQEGAPRDEAMELWLQRVPALGERLRRGRRVDPIRGVGPMATSTTRQVVPGCALVGDACGYVDPVTGEGIFFALIGAKLLAASLERALHAGTRLPHALDDYLAGRRREIESRATFGRLLQHALKHPAVVRCAAQVLASRPRLVDLLVSMTGDYAPMREFASPGVWLRAARGEGRSR